MSDGTVGIKIVAVDINQCLSIEHITHISTNLLQEFAVLATQNKPWYMLLFCISTHIEVLFPLQLVVPENLHMLKCSIETLVLFYRDTVLIPAAKRDTISQCVDYIYSSVQQVPDSGNTITDILFITCRTKLKSELEEILLEKTQCLNKKVTVVTISDNVDGKLLPLSPKCFTEIDEITISSQYIQKTIRRWLFSREKMLLKIHLPNNVALMCDIEPVLLSDTLSPFLKQTLYLSNDTIISVSHPEHLNQEHQLNAIRLIPANLVCESVLFGSPMVLKSSTHYKLDWEILEKNQHNFLAICESLRQKDMFMLCERLGEIKSLFLVLPGPSDSALIKSIACSELLLPVSDSLPLDITAPKSTLIDESLAELVVEKETFSPLKNPSLLHQYLIEQMQPMKRKLYNDNMNKVV